MTRDAALVNQHADPTRPNASRASGPRARRASGEAGQRREKLAAGEAIRCAFCLKPITSPDAAAEKEGSLVAVGGEALARPGGVLRTLGGDAV
jgi:hypothetical protein